MLLHGEFVLFYQPQVDIESGRIFSAEALLRMPYPGHKGFISCRPYMSIAEETGLILQIGEWALRQACRQLKQWRDQAHANLHIAVNLSPRQFHQENFVASIEAMLREIGLPADALDLEITESLLLERTEENVTQLKRLSLQSRSIDFPDSVTPLSTAHLR